MCISEVEKLMNCAHTPTQSRAAPWTVRTQVAAGAGALCRSCLVDELLGLEHLGVEEEGERVMDARQVVERHHRYACRERAYIMEVAHDPLRGDALCLPQWNQLKDLLPTISRCIADGPHDLRGLLIALQKGWAEFSDAPCPLDFSEEERTAHDAEDERVKAYVRNSLRVYDTLECDEVGAVLPQRYDAAKQEMERLRESWDKEEMKGPFPLYEGCYAYHLS